MIFFHEDVILKDLDRFANSIEDSYNVENVGLLIDYGIGEEAYFGFTFTVNGEEAVVKMQYLTNEMGEFAVNEDQKYWILEIGDTITENLKTLGDVFDELKLNKK